MARTVNSLGVAQYLGPRKVDLGIGYSVYDTGVEKTIVIDFDHENLPAASADDAAVPVIPANAFVVSARVYADEGFAGGTLDIGLAQKDGTAIDADGLVALGDLSAAGTWVDGDGALVGASVGAADAQVTVTGAPTSGRGQIVVKYLSV